MKISSILCLILVLLIAPACSRDAPQAGEGTRVTPQLVGIDPAYYDGIIVITQYFTYLDLGWYENAYQLLLPSRPYPQSLDDFLLGAEKAYKSVEIGTIQPYNEWARHHGLSPSNDPTGQKRFYVEIFVVGEEGWWPDNDVHFVITLGSDNEKWRILSQDTIAKE